MTSGRGGGGGTVRCCSRVQGVGEEAAIPPVAGLR